MQLLEWIDIGKQAFTGDRVATSGLFALNGLR